MQIVAAVFADFEHSFLGGESQLGFRIGSQTVFAHTLRRLSSVNGLDGRFVLVRRRDEDRARAALAAMAFGDRFELLAIDAGHRPKRELIRAARRWGLDSWRGTPLGTTWFDEYVEPLEVARLLDHCGAEAVLCVDGHQPALSIEIAQQMISHQREREADATFVFTQAPPGLAGIVLRRSSTRELVEQKMPAGLLLSYRPEAPRGDLITRPHCCRISAAVAHSRGRWIPDTRSSREQVVAGFEALGEECTAEALCEWRRREGRLRLPPLPEEIELELTTADPLPETRLRVRGARVPPRELHDLDAVSKLAATLARFDDTRLVLGGHGDPLSHPRFPEICRRLREGGVAAIGVVTPLVNLPPECLEALFSSRIDLLEIQIDADSPETYRSVHGTDAFAAVLANLQRIEAQRQSRNSPQPLLLPSLTRCAATLPELERFFDRWIAATGGAVIRGLSRFGGDLPADSLPGLTPLVRGPCRRLGRTMMLLADGTATACDQDVRCQMSVGSWLDRPIDALWLGDGLRQLRSAHAALRLSGFPLCEVCADWHRPL